MTYDDLTAENFKKRLQEQMEKETPEGVVRGLFYLTSEKAKMAPELYQAMFNFMAQALILKVLKSMVTK